MELEDISISTGNVYFFMDNSKFEKFSDYIYEKYQSIVSLYRLEIPESNTIHETLSELEKHEVLDSFSMSKYGNGTVKPISTVSISSGKIRSYSSRFLDLLLNKLNNPIFFFVINITVN